MLYLEITSEQDGNLWFRGWKLVPGIRDLRSKPSCCVLLCVQPEADGLERVLFEQSLRVNLRRLVSWERAIDHTPHQHTELLKKRD